MDNYARLSNDSMKVYCFNKSCPGVIAEIEEVIARLPSQEIKATQTALDRPPHYARVVRFSPGSVRKKLKGTDTEVWHYPQRARQDERRGRTPGPRRQARATAAFTPTTPFDSDLSESKDQRRGPKAYPAAVRCKRCGFFQWLDADRLNVVADQGTPDPNRRELFELQKGFKELAQQGVPGAAEQFRKVRRLIEHPAAKPTRLFQAMIDAMGEGGRRRPSGDP